MYKPSITDLGEIKKVATDIGLPNSCRVILGAGDGCSAAVGQAQLKWAMRTLLSRVLGLDFPQFAEEPLLDKRNTRVFPGHMQ